MPTSVNVTNLKINELTEAQYDSAVQGGVIGANELSILTDVDAGQVIQVATLPTASADELGKIYQFIGITDANYTHGYFYECTGAGEPVVYSWSQVNVQPSSSLPSQTGNSGKFLTTDGTDASWSDKPLVNKATGSNSITIGGTAGYPSAAQNIVVGSNAHIGYNQSSTSSYNVLVGGSSIIRNGSNNIAIGASAGDGSTTSMNYSIAIGSGARYNANYAIQLGGNAQTNSDANTFKVGNENGNFEMMSADGTIPHARLTNAVQSTTVTIATTDWSSNTASVTVSGLTATSVVWVAPDNASQSAYTTAGVYASAQATDTLTFTCTQTPSASLTINVVFC